MAARAGTIRIELFARVVGSPEETSLGVIPLPITYTQATQTLKAEVDDAVQVVKTTLGNIFKEDEA